MKPTPPVLISGVTIVQHIRHSDQRGFFQEIFRQSDLGREFVQANWSQSQFGVLRGMHVQRERPQAKLVTCTRGTIFDAWVDLREGSKTFGQWGGATLTANEPESIYLPAGLAHGFLVLSAMAEVQYLCTTEYDRDSDTGVRYDDPLVGINWPGAILTVSDRDRALPYLAEWSEGVQ